MRGGAWLDEREAGSAIAVVGLIGSAVMGYALVECADAEANLVEIYTTPAARDVGVGHAVIVASAAIAVASGCARLVSHALPGDRATKNAQRPFQTGVALLDERGEALAEVLGGEHLHDAVARELPADVVGLIGGLEHDLAALAHGERRGLGDLAASSIAVSRAAALGAQRLTRPKW
jgi:hypothetical protein